MVEDPHLLVGRICSISISSESVVPTVVMGYHSIDQSVDDIRRDSGNSLRRHSAKSIGDKRRGSVSNEGTLLGNQQPSYLSQESAHSAFLIGCAHPYLQPSTLTQPSGFRVHWPHHTQPCAARFQLEAHSLNPYLFLMQHHSPAQPHYPMEHSNCFRC